MSRPVTIYAEMTPNPNTMKYVADHMLVESGVMVEFLNSIFNSLAIRSKKS